LAIQSAVSDLDDPDAGRRERATAVLRSFGPLAYGHVWQAAQDSEGQRRAKQLMRPLQVESLWRARDRQVEIRPKHPKEQHLPLKLGTVIAVDGKEAWILTTASAGFNHGAVVTWGNNEYPARWVKWDEDADLALAAIPYRKKLAALPVAKGRTRGCWWNYHVNPDIVFQENEHLFKEQDKTPVRGGGMFALEAGTLRLVLVGVHTSGLWDQYTGSHVRTAGPQTVRRFLEHSLITIRLPD
jgi:hypothetical protein